MGTRSDREDSVDCERGASAISQCDRRSSHSNRTRARTTERQRTSSSTVVKQSRSTTSSSDPSRDHSITRRREPGREYVYFQTIFGDRWTNRSIRTGDRPNSDRRSWPKHRSRSMEWSRVSSWQRRVFPRSTPTSFQNRTAQRRSMAVPRDRLSERAQQFRLDRHADCLRIRWTEWPLSERSLSQYLRWAALRKWHGNERYRGIICRLWWSMDSIDQRTNASFTSTLCRCSSMSLSLAVPRRSLLFRGRFTTDSALHIRQWKAWFRSLDASVDLPSMRFFYWFCSVTKQQRRRGHARSLK